MWAGTVVRFVAPFYASGHSPSEVDFGGEFASHLFKEYCKKEEIRLKFKTGKNKARGEIHQI